jgi:thiol:disulfide interchange protein DsbD
LLLLPLLAHGQDVIHWSAKFEGYPEANSKATVLLEAKIDQGWHLYALPPTSAANIPTTIEAVAPLKLDGKIEQPKPIHKFDQNFEAEVDYFENGATFRVPVQLGSSLGGKLKVQFQACNASSCLPPTQVEVAIGAAASTQAPSNPATGTMTSESDRIAKARAEGLIPFILLAFGAGLLALLTPCVFPMVPITVSYFTKRQEASGGKGGLAHVLAFCFGIIGAFAVFGLSVTAIFGKTGVQDFATNPWVNVVIGLIFVVLALNLFGFYEINLPSGLANKVNPQSKAGLLAPLLMGMTFTITSFTCTVGFIGTVLVTAAQGEWLFALIGMLAFGTAFALPFFFLALFPSYLTKLPKSGVWLEAVKGFMGFVELAAAVKFFSNADLVWNMSPILSRDRFLWVWVAIGMATLAFLLGFIKLPHVQMPRQMGRGRMVTTTLTAIAILSLAFGARGAQLGELEAFLPPTQVAGWKYDYDEAREMARRLNKNVFVNFTGVTCTNCRWMEKNMFPRPDVTSQLEQYVKVELFTDRQTAADKKNQDLQQALTGVRTLPVYVIVTPEGEVVRKFESSTRDPQEFVGFLQGGAKVALRRRP